MMVKKYFEPRYDSFGKVYIHHCELSKIYQVIWTRLPSKLCVRILTMHRGYR
jgi:hypothetical protein